MELATTKQKDRNFILYYLFKKTLFHLAKVSRVEESLFPKYINLKGYVPGDKKRSCRFFIYAKKMKYKTKITNKKYMIG